MSSNDIDGFSMSERLLVENGHSLQEAIEIYTGDGSVDIKGNPVVKHSTGNWKACSFILGSEFCSSLAYYGVATNLITYLIRQLHEGNVSAAKNVSIWQGTCYLTPLVGAILADSYFGRYWTIALSSLLYFLGLVALTLSSTISAFRPQECTGVDCPPSTMEQSGVFLFGLYLIALGFGGVKPCVSPLGADQFDATDSKESSEKASFFNWFYFTSCVGLLVSSVFVVWIQDNIGWGLGLGIPALFMGVSTFVFLSGTSLYRLQKPKGSPFTRILQVLVASCRKWNLEVPKDKSLLHEMQNQELCDNLLFLEKAAIISEAEIKSGDFSDPWKLCSVTQVEELKTLIRLFPIWATGITFFAVIGHISIFVEQGMTMDTKIAGPLSISAATISSLDALFIIILIPIYDSLIGNRISVLKRIRTGLFFSILCIVAAAVLESYRLRTVNEAQRLSILWQTPQYFLLGVSEVMASVGLVELMYEEAPVAMRSLCSALVFLSISIGFYLSSFLLTAVTYFSAAVKGGQGWIPDDLNEGHLDYYFWLLACFCLLNMLAFMFCANRFKYNLKLGPNK